MPATNMASPYPAGSPFLYAGAPTLNANPTTGSAVIMNPFDGPAGSPLNKDNAGNFSTGAAVTGIGFGVGMGLFDSTLNRDDYILPNNYIPGVSLPNLTASPDSRLVAIGGGKSLAPDASGSSPTVPYVAGFGLLAFGGGDKVTQGVGATAGGSRDAGGGAGFGMQYVGPTIADIPNGTVLLAGQAVNRSGAIVRTGTFQFGSSTVSNGVPA
jgi:hypothetical protein